MNTILKKFLLILIVLFPAASLCAQEAAAPQIDLGITVKTLSKAVNSGTGIPEAGIEVILNGTVIERALIEADEANYSAELIIANGEWVGSDEVKVSKCAVLLNGPRFAEAIPARRSRTVNPAEIQLNSEILVYGIYLGYAETEEGPLAVVQAVGIRKL